MSREAKIGLFLGITLVILALFIFIVGDLSRLFKPSGYPLFASFDSALGIEKHTAVRLAGVKIGYVKKIELIQNQALITMNIYPGIKVPKDSKAFLASLGLLGERYIEILPGKEATFCQPGEAIASLPSVSFDQLGLMLLSIGEEIKKLSSTWQRLVGPGEKENLSSILNNLALVSQEMRHFLETSRPSLEMGARYFPEQMTEINREIKKLAQQFQGVADALKEFIELNHEAFQNNLTDLSQTIENFKNASQSLYQMIHRLEKGQGTLGHLIQDRKLYDQAQLAVNQISDLTKKAAHFQIKPEIRADYLSSLQKCRGEFSLAFSGKANSQKFFSLGLVRDPESAKFVWNLQAGLKWGVLQARTGFFESELGAGLDFIPWDKKLYFTLESFAFNREQGPKWRLLSRFYLFEHFYLTLGIDDLSLDNKKSLILGLGARR